MRNQANSNTPRLHRRHLRQMRDNSSSAGRLMQISAKTWGGGAGSGPQNFAALRRAGPVEHRRRASGLQDFWRLISPLCFDFRPKGNFFQGSPLCQRRGNIVCITRRCGHDCFTQLAKRKAPLSRSHLASRYGRLVFRHLH
jgi:hypothetical protein